MNISPNHPLRVRVPVWTIGAWVAITLVLAVNILICFSRQRSELIIFFPILLWVIIDLLPVSGSVYLDDDGVSIKNITGHYRILWIDIRRTVYENKVHSLILYGDNKKLTLPTLENWSGPEARQAFQLLYQKMAELEIGLPVEYEMNIIPHRNVRVRRD
jgi:hypothetical protein